MEASMRLASVLGLKILVTLIFCLVSNHTYAGDSFFVAPDGNDNNNGSINSPWHSIIGGIKKISPGDTLFLRGGTYSEGELRIHESEWGGGPGLFKTLKAYEGETPSLGGDRRVINGVDYMRFVGLHFRLGYMLDNGADHVEIINCTFEGSQPQFGAIEFEGSYGLIEGNTIRITGGGNTRDHGIYLHSGKDNILRNNTIIGAQGYGIHMYDERKTWDPPGYIHRYENILIEGNFVSSSHLRSGIIVSYGSNASIDGVILRNNVLVGNNFQGILVRRGINIEIYNNTTYNNGLQGINVGDGDGSDIENVVVRDNIVVDYPNNNCSEDCDWYAERHIDIAGGVKNIVVDNNLYWPSNVGNEGITDQNAIWADPLLKNPTNSDFTLQDGSPACAAASDGGDLGAYLCGTALPTPRVNRPRFQPGSGTFTGSVQVQITTSTEGADIYYTLDGSTPSTNSTPYTEPMSISENTTVKARAFKNEFRESDVATAAYTIERDAAPPELLSASAKDSAHVAVRFSEPLDQSSAENPANYVIDNSIEVSVAEMDQIGMVVTLATSELQTETSYTLTVSHVSDRAVPANTIAQNSTATFKYSDSPRATDGLLALYVFAENGGPVVRDVSGTGDALDLQIEEPEKVTWDVGYLIVNQATVLRSAAAATKIINACSASNEITTEAWVKPASTSQEGPARIVSVSGGALSRNFTIGQEYQSYDARLRTTSTGENGASPSLSMDNTVNPDLTHVVYTRDADGHAKFYKDGQLASSSTIGGDLSNWDSDFPLALANEIDDDRRWLGEFHLVAVYGRALSDEEVLLNFDAGPNPGNGKPTSVHALENQPDTVRLMQNYPNPFNPDTKISYEIDVLSRVTVTVYDMLGKKITTYYEGNRPAGSYALTWDGTDAKGDSVASGVYVYTLDVLSSETNTSTRLTRKMILMH